MDNRRFDKKRLEVLADRLKEGSEKAFDELFDSTRDYFFYFIFGIVKNDSLADDVLQETYITIYEKIHTYKGKNFLSWMMTIAHNKAVNNIRKESRMSYFDSTESEFLLKDESTEEELLLLKDMSETLTEDEQQIVMMYVLGNYTHKQIAEGLDKPLGTITWKYNEAMKKMRNKLEARL